MMQTTPHLTKLKRRAPSGKNAVRRLAYPAEGIRQDITKLLHEFELCKSLRLTDFQSVWRRLNFGAIHAGREGHREKRAFYEETFKITIKFLLFPYTIQVKVGALYLLFSIYSTQLCIPTINIHITFEDFNQLLTLHKKLIKGGHRDADYVFRRMRDVDRAFTFVASYFCNFREEVYATESNAAGENHDDVHPEKKNKTTPQCLLPMENTEPFQVLHHAPLTTLLGCRWLDQTRKIHLEYTWSKDGYLSTNATAFPNSKAETLGMSNKDVIGSIVDICKVPTPYPVSTVNGNVEQSFEPLNMSELHLIASDYLVEQQKVIPEAELEAVELEKRILPLLQKHSAELYPDLHKQGSVSIVIGGGNNENEEVAELRKSKDYNWVPNNKVEVAPKSRISTRTRSKNLSIVNGGGKNGNEEAADLRKTKDYNYAPNNKVEEAQKSTISTRSKNVSAINQQATSPQRPAPPVEVSVVDESGLPTPAVRTSRKKKKTRKSTRTKKKDLTMTVMLGQQGTTNIYKSDMKLDLFKPKEVKSSIHAKKTTNLAFNMSKIKKDEVIALQGVGPTKQQHALLGIVTEIEKNRICVDLMKSVRKQTNPYAGLLKRTGDLHWITEANIIYAKDINLTKEKMIPIQVQRTIKQFYSQRQSEDDFMRALGGPSSHYDTKSIPQIQSSASGSYKDKTKKD